MTAAGDISLPQIKELAKNLKRLKKDWVEDLSELMKKEDPDATKEKVYNIVNNIVKHQQNRRNFILFGNQLLAKLSKEQNKALALAGESGETEEQA